MTPNRVAELQLRGRAGTLQGRVYWPGPVAARLIVLCADGRDAAWCERLSAGAGAVVLAIAPGGLDDAVFAAEWAAENAARLGAGPGHLLIGGIGAGGSLAAAVAVQAAGNGWPVFGRQVLVCASPEPQPPPAGLAATTAVTVEHDPDGDDGRYAALLRHAGVAVEELRYAAPDAAAAVRIRDGRQLVEDLGTSLRRI